VGSRALRLVAFVDPDQTSSVTLLSSIVKLAAAREDLDVVAIVDAAFQPPPSSPLRVPRTLLRWGVRRAFNLTTASHPSGPAFLASCSSLARRHRIPLLAPRERGVNDPRFVEQLRALGADATIGLMVGQIFRAPLLDACKLPLNYHDGVLPRYRGVAATAWSIYERADESGFTFHVMTEEVDGGPVLLEGAVPLAPEAALWPTERAKTRLACSQLSSLFDLLLAGSGSASTQGGRGRSFSRADVRAIRAVEQPGAITVQELELRLRAFESLELTLAGRDWTTTALRKVGRRARNHRLAFTSADGVRLEPSRIAYLPPAVSRARAALRAP
jgi:Formyl transferase